MGPHRGEVAYVRSSARDWKSRILQGIEGSEIPPSPASFNGRLRQSAVSRFLLPLLVATLWHSSPLLNCRINYTVFVAGPR